MSEDKIELITSGKFTITCIHSNPIRVEAKIIFKIDTLSYKLLFRLMDITHKHGFGISAPIFDSTTEETMSFLIGTTVSSIRQIKPSAARLDKCIEEIYDFSVFFQNQMDFTNIDISMFNGIVMGDVERMVMIRDIYYGGSWEALMSAFESKGFAEAKESILRLKQFEEVNKKDIAFVSVKVNNFLDYMDLFANKDTVLN